MRRRRRPGIHCATIYEEKWIPGSRSRAPRNDGKSQTHLRLPAAQIAPELCKTFRPENQRAQGMPGASMRPQPCARNKKAHKHSHHGHTGAVRHSPRNGFNGFLRALPGEPGFFATIACGIVAANLTPASGRQNHTTSPSACRAFVCRATSVHRIPPRVHDDREPPLCGAGRGGLLKVICPSAQAHFFAITLDDRISLNGFSNLLFWRGPSRDDTAEQPPMCAAPPASRELCSHRGA
jgi:hypothetical protein